MTLRIHFCVNIREKTRVDMYLSALFQHFSRSYIQKMIDNGQLSINDKIITKNIKIAHQDEIILCIDRLPLLGVQPENIPLDIVYEDENILVINKNPGMNVHPVPGIDGNTNTLVNAVLHHCKKKLPCINGVERPGIVHRLDKDTSGLLMVAKTDQMMSYLSGVFKERKIEKYYIAIVSGKLKDKYFKIESYIGRDPKNRNKMTTKNPIHPRVALTQGEIIDYIDDKFSILRIKIETGRTHQIRVHLASIGYPILGDKVYGNKTINDFCERQYSLKRQALHAVDLYVRLYEKDFHFHAPFKDDMAIFFTNKNSIT